MTYAELHAHSAYSLLDGASMPEELVARAAELELPALALTDHDNLYGVVPFWRAAHAAGIKPILGAELTLAGGDHVTLLAESQAGYHNLCQLITAAHYDRPKGEPVLDSDLLARHHQGLLCLSGCRNGALSRHLLAGRRAEALATARHYMGIFGPDRYYIELQHNRRQADRALIADQAALAEHVGLSCVATGDTHYHIEARHRLQDVLVAIRHRTTLEASHDHRRPNSDFYLKSDREFAQRFAAYPQAVVNTLRLAERCEATLAFRDYRFPDYPVPGGINADSYLEGLCREGAVQSYGHCSGEVEEKLRYELGLIRQHGLAGYFLIVWDLMAFARRQRIPAQGRGSAANSIVAFVLGLTRVDPIRHRLFVGRFLNEELATIPDIDIDFGREHREQAIQYLRERYGPEHVALVCTFVTYTARNSVREVGKVLELPPEQLDRLARQLSHGATGIAEQLQTIPGLAGGADAPVWQLLSELCGELDGLPRHVSQHVGGMVCSSRPLHELVPIEPARMPGRTVLQWDKDSVEDAGLVKIDLLSLGMLALLDEAVRLVADTRGLVLDLERVPLDDSRVYDSLCEADTVGLFQVESRAQMQSLPQTRPRTFLDLVAQVAIIRPGPLQGNMVHPYLRRRRGEEPINYPHPRVEPVLEETLGVILYQEQCLRLAIEAAGFSAGEADGLRRAMSRKRAPEAMARLQDRFVGGCAGRGIDGRAAADLWEMLGAFAQFGFCKSHAAAFAWLTYQSAWLKLYYPAEFYCALLNNQPMGFYAPEVIVGDAKRHGVPVLPVDIDASRDSCTVENAREGYAVRLGFRYVTGLGEEQRGRLEVARREGPYRSLRDLCRRSGLAQEAIEHLIAIGACNAFGLARRELLWQLGLLYRPAEHHAATRRTRPSAAELLARRLTPPAERRPPEPPPRPLQEALPLPTAQDMVTLQPMTARDELAADYAVLGLSPHTHPLALMRARLPEDVAASRQLERLPDGQPLRMAGLVVCRQQPGTAKGFLFVTLEDEYGLANIVVRPDVYQRFRPTWRLASLVVVGGVLQRRNGVTNLLATGVEELSTTAALATPAARSFR